MEIKYIKHISKKDSSGKLKNIYTHIESNFGKIAEPFVLHSINTELTASIWAIIYETMLVETNVKRNIKETIATCISELNKCPYCVDAHGIMLLGTGKDLNKNILEVKNGKSELKTKEDQLISWALNNLNDKYIANPAFSKHQAPEIIGTAVIFHYINRMVSIFAGDTPLPTSKMKKLLKFFAANFIFKKAINRFKNKGDSIVYIDKKEESSSFIWAQKVPEIKTSFEYLKFQTKINLDKILSKELIRLINEYSKKLHLLEPFFGNEQLDLFLKKVDSPEIPIAEYCFSVMFHPYKVQKEMVLNLKANYTDAQILQVSAFASLLIAENIGNKLYSYCK